MTSSTDKDDLIARVESATGPDFAIECDILLTLGWARERRGRDRYEWFYPPEGAGGYRKSTSEYALSGDRVPRFTTSLDAALMLVPEGWFAKVDTHPFGPEASVIEVSPQKLSVRSRHSKAAAPALALTAAALKARASLQERAK